MNIGNPLLQVAFAQRVKRWPNLMYAAILFPVVGGLKRGFEPGGFEPGGCGPGGLFSVIPIKPYGVRLE